MKSYHRTIRRLSLLLQLLLFCVGFFFIPTAPLFLGLQLLLMIISLVQGSSAWMMAIVSLAIMGLSVEFTRTETGPLLAFVLEHKLPKEAVRIARVDYKARWRLPSVETWSAPLQNIPREVSLQLFKANVPDNPPDGQVFGFIYEGVDMRKEYMADYVDGVGTPIASNELLKRDLIALHHAELLGDKYIVETIPSGMTKVLLLHISHGSTTYYLVRMEASVLFDGVWYEPHWLTREVERYGWLRNYRATTAKPLAI